MIHTKPVEGATNDWLTPPSIVEALAPFDLDPCASRSQPWATAETQWTEDDDGLSRDWFGLVWCNPPYGRETWRWTERLADHGDGVALVFARTEVEGFVRTVWGRADAVGFLHGRLHFHYPVTGKRAEGNAGGGSCLVAYGGEAVRRLRSSGIEMSLLEGWR